LLSVTQKFHNNISTFPRTISATVEFGMVDPNAQANCTPTANSVASIGSISQVTNGQTQTKKYMSEENNYLLLDGSFFTPPKPIDNVSTDEIGWWSEVISDESGKFSTYPQLTLSMSAPFTSIGLTFVFSPMTGDYCNSLQIQTTDSSNNTETYTVNPNTANYVWLQQLSGITEVVVTFNSTNNPYRRVHLTEVFFGDLFQWSSENLFELNILEELDPLGNSAPPKEAYASIANNLSNFNLYLGNLQKKQQLKPYLTLMYNDGTSETVPMGTFYLYNWRNDNNYLSSTLYARDLLDIMSGTTFYKYTYSGTAITLYDLAESVIQDFMAQSNLSFDYLIDSAFQNISTTGILSSMTHHDCLMYIAQAGMGVLYVDRYNTLHLKQSVSMQPLNSMPFSAGLTLAMQETYPKIAVQDPYNYFTINIYSTSIGSSSSAIYSGAVPVSGQTSLWITYSTPASASSCSATVSGGTLVSASYYTNAAYLTVNGSGNVTINITGDAISSNSVQSVLNKAGSQPVNEVDLDNPLVTTASMASNILNWYAAECQNIYLYETNSWMDFSLECGDLIDCDSQYYTGEKQAKIIRQEYTFAAGLFGSINGKGSG
jgi:hypothetical protein